MFLFPALRRFCPFKQTIGPLLLSHDGYILEAFEASADTLFPRALWNARVLEVRVDLMTGVAMAKAVLSRGG